MFPKYYYPHLRLSLQILGGCIFPAALNSGLCSENIRAFCLPLWFMKLFFNPKFHAWLQLLHGFHHFIHVLVWMRKGWRQNGTMNMVLPLSTPNFLELRWYLTFMLLWSVECILSWSEKRYFWLPHSLAVWPSWYIIYETNYLEVVVFYCWNLILLFIILGKGATYFGLDTSERVL